MPGGSQNNIGMAGGVVLLNGEPVRIVFSRYSIYIGCTKIESIVAAHLVVLHQQKFSQGEEQILIQDAPGPMTENPSPGK